MLRTISNDQEKKILEEVKRIYVTNLDVGGLILLQAGENKLRATTRETYEKAKSMKGVQLVGLYIAKRRKNFITLTIEGCMFLSKLDESTVVNLNRDQAIAWMRGGPVRVGKAGGLVIGRYKSFLLGSAIVDRLGNAYPQIPTWRRIPPETG